MFFYMVSVTLSIPEEVKKKMDNFEEINWSGFIRKVILKKTKELEWKEAMLEKVNEEEKIAEWAQNLTKKDRERRIKQLKKKGLF